METSIHKDEKDENIYTVTIDDKASIQTLWGPENYCGFRVKQWVKEIKQIYVKKKKKKKQQNLVVGLSVDRSTHYANGYGNYSGANSGEDKPFELVQICVGSHCLIYEPILHPGRYGKGVTKELRDLLADNRTVVASVGIHDIAKKLAKDFGLLISRPVDLRELATAAKGLEEGYYRKYRLEKLAKVVLGEEWNVVRPGRMNWWNDDYTILSADKIKYGTVEAFLAHKMGMELMRVSQEEYI